MASPFTFLRRNPLILGIPARTLAVGGAAVGVATVAVVRTRSPRRSIPAVSTAAAGDAGTGAAPTPGPDVAALIGQGASLALQGAGLGLPLAAAGLGIAGSTAAGSLDLAQLLAQSQVAAAQSLASSLATSLGLLPSFAPVAGITPQNTTQPTSIIPIGAMPPPTSPPAPSTAPPPVPAVSPPTLVRYEVVITGPEYVGGAIVNPATCSLSVRDLYFTPPTAAPVARGVCNGRVYWTTLSGGLAGISYVAGFSGGPWHIERVMSDGSRVNIGQSGS